MKAYQGDFYESQYRVIKDQRLLEGGYEVNEARKQQKLAKSRRLFDSMGPYLCSLRTDSPKVLDIGCAQGWLLDIFRGNGWETAGCEPDKHDAIYAASKGHHVIQGLFSSSMFSGHKFDLVILTNVLEHIPDLDNLIGALRELTSEAGLVFINVPCLDFLPIHQGKASLFSVGHVNFFTRDSLRHNLESFGLSLVAIFDDDTYNSIYGRTSKAYCAILARNSGTRVTTKIPAYVIEYTLNLFADYYSTLQFRHKVYISVPFAWKIRCRVNRFLAIGLEQRR